MRRKIQKGREREQGEGERERERERGLYLLLGGEVGRVDGVRDEGGHLQFVGFLILRIQLLPILLLLFTATGQTLVTIATTCHIIAAANTTGYLTKAHPVNGRLVLFHCDFQRV